jgi:hypothetical protein
LLRFGELAHRQTMAPQRWISGLLGCPVGYHIGCHIGSHVGSHVGLKVSPLIDHGNNCRVSILENGLVHRPLGHSEAKGLIPGWMVNQVAQAFHRKNCGERARYWATDALGSTFAWPLTSRSAE